MYYFFCRSIGLGNGHKKSKQYETFVINKRQYLREDMHLCERATQKILLYSNNFLHKRLKTENVSINYTSFFIKNHWYVLL